MEIVRVQRKVSKRVLIGITLAIFVAAVTIFAFSTNRYSNLTDIYMERWSELPNETDNIWCDNYQRVDEKFYYVNEENVLCVKEQKDEKEIVENESLPSYYSKGDDVQSGIYFLDIEGNKYNKISDDSGLYLIELSGNLYACDTGFLFMDLREIGELYEE